MPQSDSKKTIQHLKVTCYDTDVAHFLKPGAFMDMAQEIAYVSADSLGFGYDDLQRFGTAWVLSRFEIHFLQMPRWKDAVELQTWHKGFEGPFYVRDFRLLGADGQPAVAATSSWLIIDTATRRLLRREHLADKLPLEQEEDPHQLQQGNPPRRAGISLPRPGRRRLGRRRRRGRTQCILRRNPAGSGAIIATYI